MEWYTQEGERHLDAKGRGKRARESGRARTRSIERAFVAAAVCALSVQYVAECFSELQCVAMCVLHRGNVSMGIVFAAGWDVLPCVAVCRSMLQSITV